MFFSVLAFVPRLQDDLAGALAVLDQAMHVSGLGERKRSATLNFDLAGQDKADEFAQSFLDDRRCLGKTENAKAHDSLVVMLQGPGGDGRGLASGLADDDQSPERRQRFERLGRGLAADQVKHYVHAAPAGQIAHHLGPTGRGVVDRHIGAQSYSDRTLLG